MISIMAVLAFVVWLALGAALLVEFCGSAKGARFVVRVAGAFQPSRRDEFIGELHALQLTEQVPGFDYAVGALAGAVVERADSLRSPLVLRDVSKTFGTTRALHNVNLNIRAGTITALMGANGAGKTTLLRLLAGQEALEHGHITFGNVDVNTGPQAPEGIVVIRADDPLINGFTVADNIVFGQGRNWLINRSRERNDSAAALAAIGATIDPHQIMGTLTLPERLQVLLAREVHLNRAELIVLDEPTGGLSDGAASRIFDSIRAVQQAGFGVLFVSHRIDQVFRVADRVAVLVDGQIVHDSTIAATCPTDILAKVTAAPSQPTY